MKEVIWDLEADNLLDNISKIHCLSYRFVETPNEVETLVDYTSILDWFKWMEEEQHVAIGHNIIGYDFKVVEKVLNYKYSGKRIDTLPLSWYLNHDRRLHGLESYGEDFGVPKPVIDDWSTQTIEDYKHRCEEDTMINYHVWLQLKGKLQEIYNETL